MTLLLVLPPTTECIVILLKSISILHALVYNEVDCDEINK